MSWELTIRRRDGQPLGDPAAVRPVIEEAFPGVEFYRAASGAEMIESAARAGAPFPESSQATLRAVPAYDKGEWERDGCFVEFTLGEPGAVVAAVSVSVKGDHERAELPLRELARASGWGIDQWAVGGRVPFAD